MFKFVLLLVILFPLTLLSQPTAEQIRQVEEAKKEVKKMKGQSFPSFKLSDMDGTVYSKEELNGKIFLINFWFTRCTPCIQEMPEMNKLVDEFRGEGVVFLAPTFDDENQIHQFLNKRDFNYTIIPDEKDFCLELNVRSYPTHFVVNEEGIIEKVIIGYSSMTVRALRKSIRKLLKSK